MSGHDLLVGIGRGAFAGLALAATTLAGNAALGQTASILDVVVLDEPRVDGEKFGEFSALVRHPDGSGVIAVSDRGYIADIGVTVVDGRLALALPDTVQFLTGADGEDLQDAGFNPEGATLLADGSIAIVSETGPALAVFDRTGQWLRNAELPAGLRDASLQSSRKDGVEALAWTEATGLLAMLEEPALGQPRNGHSLHTELAGVSALDLPGTESISIKGMETAGGQLLILERTRDDATDALLPHLRRVDLAACLATADCTGQSVPIIVPGISDADFEGLAVLDDGQYLIVSDDKIDGLVRSVFVLFRLE